MRTREAESKPAGVGAEREQPASLNVHSLSREGISVSTQAFLLTPGRALVDWSRWVRVLVIRKLLPGSLPSLTPPTLAPVLELSLPLLKAETGPLTAQRPVREHAVCPQRPQVTMRKQHTKQVSEEQGLPVQARSLPLWSL